MRDKGIVDKIEAQWDIDGLVKDMCETPWEQTEPHRCDRMIYVGSHQGIREMAKEVYSEKEWAEAEEKGFECEIMDEYLDILADIVSEGKCPLVEPKGVKEWRPGKRRRQKLGHVYGTFANGDAFLGQYEDRSAEEMREAGHNVED